jgi:uncharacterized membrane protein
MAQANIKAVITAEDRASAALKNFGNNASSMGSKIKKGLKIAAVATAAAGAAAIAFGVSSVKSFQESENAVAQLNAVLKSTKSVAGVTAKSAINLANSLQKVTKFSDEDVISAENLLLTFTKIGKDIFPQATKTVLDMSTALGQDTKASAIQLGKALQDPILGITALRRVGVNFSDAQKDVIQNLVETGRSAEAQRLILKELNTEFGGSAEAAGKTFSGRLAILKNQFDEVKESIGKVIVEAITPLMASLAAFVASDQFQAWLTNLTNWLKINLPLAIAWLKDEGLPLLKNAFNVLWPVIKTTAEVFKRIIEFINNNMWVLWSLIAVLGTLKVAFAISGVISKFKTALAGARAAYVLTSAVLSTPILITIAVAAALAAMALVRRSAQQTMDALDQLDRANANMLSAQSDARGRLLRIAGDPSRSKADRSRARSQIEKGDKAGTFASGGYTGRGNANQVAGIVHKGEYVVPKSLVNQNTGMPNMGGSTTINITVPMMTGSANERRKVARMLIKDIQDIAQMNGKSVSDMMTSNYGLVT